MPRQLVLSLAFCLVLVSSGLTSRTAQAGYCTVGDIVDGVLQGISIQEVLRVCTEVDVQCSVDEVYEYAAAGYSPSEIYSQCS